MIPQMLSPQTSTPQVLPRGETESRFLWFAGSRQLGWAGVVSSSLTSGFGPFFLWDAMALSPIAWFL